MPYGTLATFDTLAASQQSLAAFGEDAAYDAIQAYLEAHNTLTNQALGELCEPTTDRLRRFGGVSDISMTDADEYTRADAQKISQGHTVGLKMKLSQATLQWTKKYFENVTAAEFAAQIDGMLTSDLRNRMANIKRAIFTPTNATVYDYLVDNVSLGVKALTNADSQAIPAGPNAETFTASTHTHYLARAGGSLDPSDISALIITVREHYNGGAQRLYINSAQEAAVRAMTNNFIPYLPAQIIGKTTADQAVGDLRTDTLNNRPIGIFDSSTEVWVKPWMIANYLFTYVTGAPKPLALRTRRPGSGGIRFVSEIDAHPMRCRIAEAEYGISVSERTNGAVLYSGGTSYVAPTITG